MLQEGASSVEKSQQHPMLDDGILGERLRRTAIPEERKHPAILAKDHYVSTLILHHIHIETGQVQKRYWIINCNSAARKILSHCVTCRKNRARPREQKMADLPSERLDVELPPFSNIGLDYFGPFEVRRGRTILKRYSMASSLPA